MPATALNLLRGMASIMTSSTNMVSDAFTPRSVTRLAFDIMQQSAAAVRWFAPWRESRCALQEFQNKLEAFNLFAHVDSVLSVSTQEEIRLPELIRKIESLGPYRAMWATEGLGYYLTTRFGEQSETPRKLLNGERGGDISEKHLVALHSGLGLAIADRFLKTIGPESDESAIRKVIDQFLMACRDNARSDYLGVVYESLGLVTRNLYPQMIPQLDHELGRVDEDLVGYFWHGVGRGIYFAPTNFLPDGNSERAVNMTRQEPRHELGRRNAIAGLAWAITLVNIRHPEILESFLNVHGSQLGDRGAFSDGVSSAIIIWRDSTAADDPYLQAFCRYQPDSSDGTLTPRWEQMVRRPCLRALEDAYPALKARRCLGDVFHCHDTMVR
jgi:hypothetical protein